MTCFNNEVREVQISTTAALGLASTFPKPVVIGWPTADCEDHTVSQIVGHHGVRATVANHLNSIVTLRHSCYETAEATITFVEIKLDVEPLFSIDFETSAGTVVWVSKLVDVVLPARSRSIAVIVESSWTRVIALMSSRLPWPLISFHDIEFRTVVTTYLIRITVVVTISIPQIAVLILTRHANQVQSGNAATVTSG